MNRYEMRFAPQWWSPCLSPRVIRSLRRWRGKLQRREVQLEQVEVLGGDQVRDCLKQGLGVLITPNHPSHADPFAMYSTADQLETPIYIMAAWHVFAKRTRVGRWLLRRHGVFSVDREATDLRAFRQGVEILQQCSQPLVIFPEGEIYHSNDQVTPFREGPAAMALAASKKAERPVVCIPCGIRYRYLDDPTDQLVRLMGELEESIYWRPRTDQPLVKRIYDFAEAILCLKEKEYLGAARTGCLRERKTALCDAILARLETQYGVTRPEDCLPKRVKELRRRILEKLKADDLAHPDNRPLHHDLDDIFLTLQLFSYPGNYLTEDSPVERFAETLDKFEEDILRAPTAGIRGRRAAQVQFGEPMEIVRGKINTAELTSELETRVQSLLTPQPTPQPLQPAVAY